MSAPASGSGGRAPISAAARRIVAALATILLCAALAWPAVAPAQSVPSAYTTGYRWDGARRLTGEISPSPSGTTGPFLATRYTYNADGQLTKAEDGHLTSWQAETTLPANWAGFTVHTTLEIAYDPGGRPISQTVKGDDGQPVSLTQFTYDERDRLLCQAVRMNPAAYSSLPASACTLGTQGSNGPDRVSETFYDNANRQIQLHKAVGTALEQAYVTYSYTPDGKQDYVVDANGNRAELTYDGFDRQQKWVFPSATRPSSFNPATQTTALATAGSTNASDYEQYGYDANGNRTSLRKRDGTQLGYQYDALSRQTVKTPDTGGNRTELDASYKQAVYYGYDLRGLQTRALFGPNATDPGLVQHYDGFGQLDSATDKLIALSGGGNPALSFQYDLDGNRTRITHPDTIAFDMVFDGLDRLDQLKNGSTVLADPAYSVEGRLSAIARFNAALGQSFGYDHAGRVASLDIGQGQTNSAKVGWDFTRNPASQIVTDARDNDAYTWTGRANVSATYTTNGLNQYTQYAGNEATGFCYDANGNLTADQNSAYLYDVENRLVEMHVREAPSACPAGASGYGGQLQARLHYDPDGRLYESLGYVSGVLATTTRFVYDGDALVLEYDGNGAILNRYVHGADAKADDPLIWYPGAGTAAANIRNLYADARGSIVLVMDQSGSTAASNTGINTYDEWGANKSTNVGRFQYTGQAWLPEVGLYYYKARFYSPALGRFMQTDPVGYQDQMDLYEYVGDDPIDGVDFSGDQAVGVGDLNPGTVCGGNPKCASKFVEGQKKGLWIGLAIAFGLWQPEFGPEEIAAEAAEADAAAAGNAGTAAEGSASGTPQATGPEVRRLPEGRIQKPPPRRGSAPIGDDGKPVELHHTDQDPDSALEETTRQDHREGENFQKNHKNTGQENSKIDRKDFAKTRKKYWKKEWDRGRWRQ